MSRWSTDRLRVALAPGEIALARRNGAPARTFAAREAGLRGLLPALAEALSDSEWQTGRVEIVLSQHFVRHVVTPAPGKTLSRDEEHALVRGTFESIYGEAAAGWRVDVISQPPQFGLLGAAVDAGFLAQLEQLLAAHAFTHVSIQPLASLAVHRLPRNFNGWWVLAEPGWMTLFSGTGRVWRHVAAQPVDANWTALLPELIARETELASSEPGAPTVWLQPVGTGPVAPPLANAEAEWQVLQHHSEARGAHALLDI